MARTEASLPGAVPPRIVTVSSAHGDTIVVRLRGDHDLSTVSALAAMLASAVAGEDGNLVVDLSEVQFINAATIRVLGASADFMRAQRRTFTLRSPPRGAQRILELCDASGLCEPEGT
jgi:anti-anti-sigma factor